MHDIYKDEYKRVWEMANEDAYLPTANPDEDSGDDPVFIGSRPTGKTVVVGEEANETIYSNDIKPIDLEEVR